MVVDELIQDSVYEFFYALIDQFANRARRIFLRHGIDNLDFHKISWFQISHLKKKKTPTLLSRSHQPLWASMADSIAKVIISQFSKSLRVFKKPLSMVKSTDFSERFFYLRCCVLELLVISFATTSVSLIKCQKRDLISSKGVRISWIASIERTQIV
jgi:hypothetical protein